MFKIKEKELDCIIHDLIRIASILNAIDDGHLSSGQKQIMNGSETRLHEIRDYVLTHVKTQKEDKNESDNGNNKLDTDS